MTLDAARELAAATLPDGRELTVRLATLADADVALAPGQTRELSYRIALA